MIKTLEANKTSSSQPAYVLRFAAGLAVVLALSLIAWWVKQQVYGMKLPFGISGQTLEYPLWAALAGLVGNVLLRLFGAREMVKPGIRTELFLKIGLVLMGATINIASIIKNGLGGALQTVIMIPSVFFFAWWVGGKFGLDEKLRAVMATALSVCGVSAAIAAAGSVSARKEQVTYITGLVILVALPMMVLMPLIGNAVGLPQAVAGAWFGGNIDTTAAVTGAGTMYGAKAQEVAVIVKSTQNAMIGVVAFLLAVVFAGKNVKDGEPAKARPNARIIWDRFPKFVIGFVVASILFSIGLVDGGKGSAIESLRNWAFTLAFVCMGLELSASAFREMGWKPVAVFLIVTVFNTLLAFGAAWVIFNYLFPLA